MLVVTACIEEYLVLVLSCIQGSFPRRYWQTDVVVIDGFVRLPTFEEVYLRTVVMVVVVVMVLVCV